MLLMPWITEIAKPSIPGGPSTRVVLDDCGGSGQAGLSTEQDVLPSGTPSQGTPGEETLSEPFRIRPTAESQHPVPSPWVNLESLADAP